METIMETGREIVVPQLPLGAKLQLHCSCIMTRRTTALGRSRCRMHATEHSMCADAAAAGPLVALAAAAEHNTTHWRPFSKQPGQGNQHGQAAQTCRASCNMCCGFRALTADVASNLLSGKRSPVREALQDSWQAAFRTSEKWFYNFRSNWLVWSS